MLEEELPHMLYSYKQPFCLVIISYLLIHAGLELNVRNVLNVLHEARFADANWAELGLQLMIDYFDLSTIKADHSQANLCMIDTISQWLKSDPKASWEKLVEALQVGGYGEATAAIVREKAGILPTGMSHVWRSVSIFCEVPIHRETAVFWKWQK